jgi:hypothetical protein
MQMNASSPPPVIDSMRTLWFALVDDGVVFTDRICLLVDGEPIGKVPRLAICQNYSARCDHMLCFCDEEWVCKGVIAFRSAEEAKERAEAGYNGLGWERDDTSEEEVARFLREEYEVDPEKDWWRTDCSFCGKDMPDVEGMLAGDSAQICYECVRRFFEHITNDRSA